jgi:hypothetical protein
MVRSLRRPGDEANVPIISINMTIRRHVDEERGEIAHAMIASRTNDPELAESTRQRS